MLFFGSSRACPCSELSRRIGPPALPVDKQLTLSGRVASPSCCLPHCPASSQPPPPASPPRAQWVGLLGSGWFCCCWQRGSFFLWFVLKMYAKETGKQTAEKKVAAKCSAKLRRHRKRHTHTDTLQGTLLDTHTNTLHCAGDTCLTTKQFNWRGVGAYSAAQANGNNNGKSRGERGTNYAGKWVKKHFQADCSSRKGWKIYFNKLLGKKRKVFPFVKGELKAQSALCNDCIKARAATAAAALNELWTLNKYDLLCKQFLVF